MAFSRTDRLSFFTLRTFQRADFGPFLIIFISFEKLDTRIQGIRPHSKARLTQGAHISKDTPFGAKLMYIRVMPCCMKFRMLRYGSHRFALLA